MQGQSKTTYHQQVTYCGKPRCRKCREGIGHGPYWYAYQMVNGQTTRRYIGKNLPPDALATIDVKPTHTGEPAMSGISSSSTPPISVPLLRVFTLGQFRLERSSLSIGKGLAPSGADTSANLGQAQGTAVRSDARSSVAQWHVVTEAAWQQRQESQVRALLGYLLCSPGRRAHRSQLLAALWPGDDNEASTRYLNKALHLLQRVLGYGVGKVPTGEADKTDGQAIGVSIQPLQLDDDWFVLAGQEHIWVD